MTKIYIWVKVSVWTTVAQDYFLTNVLQIFYKTDYFLLWGQMSKQVWPCALLSFNSFIEIGKFLGGR